MTQEAEGHKIFIGDLPADITVEELQTVFATYGEVTNIHLMQPSPKSNNRCALLFYRERDSGEDAIKVLNGIYKIREDAPQAIKVAWARERGPMAQSGPQPAGADGYKLFVGGLPMDIKDEELRMVFSTYGEVTNMHIMPPHKDNGRVAAFVYYAKAESCQDAISVLDLQYKIRTDAEEPIQVKWAMSKDTKGGGKGWDSGWGGGKGWDNGGYGGGSKGGGKGFSEKCQTQDGWKLFVGGLPLDCTEEELNAVFSTYGTLRKVLLMPPHQMSGRVAAFIFYESDQSAEDAIKVLDGIYKIRQDAEAPITVKWGTDKRAGGGKGCGDGGAWGGGGGGWNQSSFQSGKGGGKQAIGWNQGGGGWNQGGYQGGGYQSGGYQGGGYQGGYQSGGGGGWGGKGCGDGGWGGGAKGGWSGGGGGKGGGLSDTKLFVGNLPPDITEDSIRYVFQTYGSVTNIHLMMGKSKTGNACAFVEFAQPQDADSAIMTLNDKYEIKPGFGTIMVKKANAGQRTRPY